jgi:hypothetical protein
MFTQTKLIDDPELRAVFAKTFRDMVKKIMDEAQSYSDFLTSMSERGFHFNTTGEIRYYPNENKNEYVKFDIDKDLHLQTNFEIMIDRIKKNILERKNRKKQVAFSVSVETLKEIFSEEENNYKCNKETSNNQEKYRQELIKIAEDKKNKATNTHTNTRIRTRTK